MFCWIVKFVKIPLKIFSSCQVCCKTLWNFLLLALSESWTPPDGHALPLALRVLVCRGTSPDTCVNMRGYIRVTTRMNRPQRENSQHGGVIKINEWKKEVVLNVASCRRVSHDVCFALCLRLNCNFFLSFTMPKVGGNLHTVINWVTGDLELPHTCRFLLFPYLPRSYLSPPPKADVDLFTYSTPQR